MYVDNRTVMDDIRQRYLPEYVEQVKAQKPFTNSLARKLFGTGVTSTVLGVLAGIGAGIVAYVGAPFLLPAIGIAAGLVATGVTELYASSSINSYFRKVAAPVMEADIASYKLVKRYALEGLTGDQKALDTQRAEATSVYKQKTDRINEQEETLREKRKTTLGIIMKGMGSLEAQVRLSERDLAQFKADAQTAFGEDFTAASAQKKDTAALAAPMKTILPRDMRR